jgi:hypothetical protein
MVDGLEIPSRVLPLDAGKAAKISVEHGPIRFPYLDCVNAVLHTAAFHPGPRRMRLALSSFKSHSTTVRIVTPWMVRSVMRNGRPWRDVAIDADPLGLLIVNVRYPASAELDTLDIQF